MDRAPRTAQGGSAGPSRRRAPRASLAAVAALAVAAAIALPACGEAGQVAAETEPAPLAAIHPGDPLAVPGRDAEREPTVQADDETRRLAEENERLQAELRALSERLEQARAAGSAAADGADG